jgi:hypothetical protein
VDGRRRHAATGAAGATDRTSRDEREQLGVTRPVSATAVRRISR